MKKTFLAVTMLSALSLSSGANAAFVEGNNFTGTLDFNGTITNDNPIWKWQIPDTAKTSVDNVSLRVVSGVNNGSKTSWNITNTEQVILEGYMKTLAERGGAGLTPIVIIGGQNMLTCSIPAPCPVSIVATDNDGATVGSVEFSLSNAGGTALMYQGKTYVNGVHGISTARARELVTKTTGFDEFYSRPDIVNLYNQYNMDQLDTFLRNVNHEKITSSRVYTMSRSTLNIPNGTPAPAVWRATLPITISVV